MHLRQQHVFVQPRRLSRAAGKLCRKHAWNARSKQRHVPDTKQVLLWKGWVLKQRLDDVQSRVGATAARAHAESPLRTKLFVDSCSARHQGNCCASTREITATWISMFMRQDCCALTPQAHTWVSLRAQRDMFRQINCCVLAPRAHLDLFACANRHVLCDNTAAFARCEHTWISLRAQRDMFRLIDSCVLTPGAHLDLAPCAKRHVASKGFLRSHSASTLGHFSVRKQEDMFMRQHCCVHTTLAQLDLSPCAKRHVPANRLLRSHAASTLGSCSVRKETCSIEKTAAISRCPPR